MKLLDAHTKNVKKMQYQERLIGDVQKRMG